MFLSAPSAQVLELQLTFPQGDPFGFKYNRAQPPLYVQLDEFRRALKNLNTAMGDYAGLLAQLAGNDTVNKAQFDQLATELNKNVTSAAATLNLGLSGTAPAFFSTAAAKIFQDIIERKRKKKLRQAILAQQDRMKLYSEAAQNALVIIVQGVRPRYDDQFSASSEKYFAASNDAAKTAALQGQADLVVSSGSSLTVEPAASVPLTARQSGAFYAIVNQGPTAHDGCADLVINRDVTRVLPEVAGKILKQEAAR